MSLVGYLIAIGIVTIGTTIQGSLGFGLGLVAAPVLALIKDELIPGPLLLVGLAVTTSVFIREHGSVDWSGMKWALVGRVIGTVLGAVFVVVTSKDFLIVTMSLMLIAGVLMSSIGWRVAPNPSTLVTAGTLSGVMGTLTSVGGPPIALVYQHETAQKLRSTLAGFFLFGASFSLVSLAIGGGMGVHELRLGFVLLPGFFLGLVASRWAAKFLDNGYSRPAVLIFSAGSSLVLLIQVLVS